jgi:hypothetical protein
VWGDIDVLAVGLHPFLSSPPPLASSLIHSSQTGAIYGLISASLVFSGTAVQLEGFAVWAASDALRSAMRGSAIDLLGHFGGALAGWAWASVYMQL